MKPAVVLALYWRLCDFPSKFAQVRHTPGWRRGSCVVDHFHAGSALWPANQIAYDLVLGLHQIVLIQFGAQ